MGDKSRLNRIPAKPPPRRRRRQLGAAGVLDVDGACLLPKSHKSKF
jgi:hypothetical protein